MQVLFDGTICIAVQDCAWQLTGQFLQVQIIQLLQLPCDRTSTGHMYTYLYAYTHACIAYTHAYIAQLV